MARENTQPPCGWEAQPEDVSQLQVYLLERERRGVSRRLPKRTSGL
jgi:hypothetical protein